jgi:hypothetical protein
MPPKKNEKRHAKPPSPPPSQRTRASEQHAPQQPILVAIDRTDTTSPHAILPDPLVSGHVGAQSGVQVTGAAVGAAAREAERMRLLELQIVSMHARIQDLESQLAASASSLHQSSLQPTAACNGAQVASPLSSSAPSSLRVPAVVPNDPLYAKCAPAVASGLRRRDIEFLRQVFQRHEDGTCRLTASNLVLALTDADAPVIPESEAAAAQTIFLFDCNSNGLMKFCDFERAINQPDELALYFQEKRQPLLADALRALVGRGNDQLLRVSQLSVADMRAASDAVCASIPEQTELLFNELQRSFAAQFEIQAQAIAGTNKFDVVKMACGGIQGRHETRTLRKSRMQHAIYFWKLQNHYYSQARVVVYCR